MRGSPAAAACPEAGTKLSEHPADMAGAAGSAEGAPRSVLS